MSIDYVILEQNMGRNVSAHRFSIPSFGDKREPGEKSFYVNTVSINAFKRKQMAAAFPADAGIDVADTIRWYDVYYLGVHPRQGLTRAQVENILIGLPIFDHASLWDFYKAIGWNYKAGKLEA